MSHGSSVTLHQPFDEVVTAVRIALATQGFGVLTEVDVQATLKTKLDADTAPYLILGACNPSLAHRALQVDASVGLLLPCNVVVRQVASGTTVEAIDPMMMVDVSGNLALQAVAVDAAGKLAAALAALTS
jgi:uncharacterized protein (DUF302 family)